MKRLLQLLKEAFRRLSGVVHTSAEDSLHYQVTFARRMIENGDYRRAARCFQLALENVQGSAISEMSRRAKVLLEALPRPDDVGEEVRGEISRIKDAAMRLIPENDLEWVATSGLAGSTA